MVNRKMERAGHIFQGRFKSILIEKDSHLLELTRYIVLNPVRAKMVRSPREWRWSSYRATAGQTAAADFLTVTWILEQFGDTRPRRIAAYRKFVQQGKGAKIWDQLQRGHLLGTEEFIALLLNEQSKDIEFNLTSACLAGHPLRQSSPRPATSHHITSASIMLCAFTSTR